MNKDREAIEQHLKQRGTPMKLNGRNVWERLSSRDATLMRAMAVEAFDGCPKPANFHRQQAEFNQASFETGMIGSVPPVPASATELISYHDPGGASTSTELELLTLKMINNHEAADKFYHSEDRAQRNKRASNS